MTRSRSPGMTAPHPKRDRPAYGSPCNGCGECCIDTPCPLAQHLFGLAEGPCPALIDHGDSYGCGVVETPRRYAPTKCARHGAGVMSRCAAAMIGTGCGCDMRSVLEPAEPMRSQMLARGDEKAALMGVHLWRGPKVARRLRPDQAELMRTDGS